jgi:hypothetical protein
MVFALKQSDISPGKHPYRLTDQKQEGKDLMGLVLRYAKVYTSNAENPRAEIIATELPRQHTPA